MAQFANTVVGEPVENWQGGNNFLGFSRGSKGFVAMGDLGRDFNTGMPDGEHQLIILEMSADFEVLSQFSESAYQCFSHLNL